MLTDHIESQILHLLDIINHRLICRCRIKAIRPVSLIQYTFLEIWLIIQIHSRNSFIIILHFYLAHGKIAVYLIVSHRDTDII